jgi:hypothetical protein
MAPSFSPFSLLKLSTKSVLMFAMANWEAVGSQIAREGCGGDIQGEAEFAT